MEIKLRSGGVMLVDDEIWRKWEEICSVHIKAIPSLYLSDKGYAMCHAEFYMDKRRSASSFHHVVWKIYCALNKIEYVIDHKTNSINHKDGNKLNNMISNLENVSNLENSKHYWKGKKRGHVSLNDGSYFAAISHNGKQYRKHFGLTRLQDAEAWLENMRERIANDKPFDDLLVKTERKNGLCANKGGGVYKFRKFNKKHNRWLSGITASVAIDGKRYQKRFGLDKEQLARDWLAQVIKDESERKENRG